MINNDYLHILIWCRFIVQLDDFDEILSSQLVSLDIEFIVLPINKQQDNSQQNPINKLSVTWTEI